MSPNSIQKTFSGNSSAILPDNAIFHRNKLIRSVLSYDNVKAHRGSIEVKSNIDEGTEFEISLPVNKIL